MHGVPTQNVAVAAQQQREYGRELCRAHAGPLIAVAALLLDDVDEVCRVVSDAITAAVEADAGLDADPFLARQRLTASVRQRCHGRLATRERFR